MTTESPLTGFWLELANEDERETLSALLLAQQFLTRLPDYSPVPAINQDGYEAALSTVEQVLLNHVHNLEAFRSAPPKPQTPSYRIRRTGP